MKHAVESEMNRLITNLINYQSMDGLWDYAFETGISTDSYMIILLRTLEIHDENLIQALTKRVLRINWVFSMQNDDGGWPAFERNVDKKILDLLPVQGAGSFLLDPSTADLTGRTLEFLGNDTNLNKNHPSLKRGRKWLRNHQEMDGSWYGRWGICYIYGTWAAVTGLIASGKRPESSVIQQGVAWLRHIQNEDGGWGESCRTDTQKKYVPLGKSTLTDTAWALDALIAASDRSTPEIQAGIIYLIENGNRQDWTEQYPKGQGMGGAFYIHYHSYRYIWPLLALSHYKKKFLRE